MPATKTKTYKKFSDKQKALLYARELAICAFCGRDLWILRNGIGPEADEDWADHILPASRGGDSSLENGVAVCSACNSKKSNNTRDREYFYRSGKPSKAYLMRFDRLNPIVASTALANRQIHWTDWYFNRVLAKLSLGVCELWSRQTGDEPYKRGPEFWGEAALGFAEQWRRHVQFEGVAHPRERGLFPTELDGDQHLMLQVFEARGLQDVLSLMEGLVPYYIGDIVFLKLKIHGLADPALGLLILSLFREGSSENALHLLFNHPRVLSHQLAEELTFADVTRREEGCLVPCSPSGWPQLPQRRLSLLLEELNALPTRENLLQFS